MIGLKQHCNLFVKDKAQKNHNKKNFLSGNLRYIVDTNWLASMETKGNGKTTVATLHVLLVGNNPIEMSLILEKLDKITGTKIITETAFDLKSILERLIKFEPNFILIDDNIGRVELTNTVQALAQSKKTKDIPITVLKNSNYKESYYATSILDYLLKTNLSTDALYNTLRNSLRFRKTQEYLYKAYNKRKKILSVFY